MLIDAGPPVRLIATITLICSVLDIAADIIMCIKLNELVGRDEIVSETGTNCVTAYYVFVAITLVIFVFEVIDCYTTIKNNRENPELTPITKSLMIVLEELPLPLLMLLICINDPAQSVTAPALLFTWIKLVTLSWGIVKFMKFKCCWLCLPCLYDHGFAENVRRCFHFTPRRIAMILVNICHAGAIAITIINIIQIGPQQSASYQPTSNPFLTLATTTTTPAATTVVKKLSESLLLNKHLL